MKKLAIGLMALMAVGFTGTAGAQTVTPSQDNDVEISDNQVIVVSCVQNGEVTQSVAVEGESPEDADVREVKQNFEQENCKVTINVKSTVDHQPTATPTATSTPTPTVTTAPTVTTTPTPEVEEEVEVVVPQGAPATGRGGN